MNTDKIYAESIAKDYAPKDNSKIIALKKLDNTAKLPATNFTYSCGIISALVFGTGMCLAMQVYETIGDLLSETIRYLLDDFLAYFPFDTQTVSLNLNACQLDELVFISAKYLNPYFSYLKDHKEIFMTAFVNNKIFGLEDIYKRMFENILSPVLDRFHYPQNIKNYILMYYINGINAIICEC